MLKILDNVDVIGLEQVIETHPIVAVEFWATWCTSCESFSKIFSEVAENEDEVCFVKMKIDDASSVVMDSLGIQSVPHLMIFKHGQVVFSEAGTLPKKVLQDFIMQTKNLKL